MREKPIIFSGEMVRAILDGRKTQTRRLIKPQPDLDGLSPSWVDSDHIPLHVDDFVSYGCSLYQKGDHLWVREGTRYGEHGVIYRSDGDGAGYWRSPIHMFKKDARLWLEVLNVRVEGVQDISETDAWAEGTGFYQVSEDGNGSYILPFEEYWDTIHKKKPEYQWQANPWVWVYEFKRKRLGGL